MKLIRIIAVTLIFSLLCGCVTMNNGANWFLADFSAYDKNYNDFDTSKITIGMSDALLISTLGIKYTMQAETKEYKVLQFEKWRSVAGPDYVEKKMFVKIVNGHVDEYKVVNDAVIINPW